MSDIAHHHLAVGVVFILICRLQGFIACCILRTYFSGLHSWRMKSFAVPNLPNRRVHDPLYPVFQLAWASSASGSYRLYSILRSVHPQVSDGSHAEGHSGTCSRVSTRMHSCASNCKSVGTEVLVLPGDVCSGRNERWAYIHRWHSPWLSRTSPVVGFIGYVLTYGPFVIASRLLVGLYIHNGAPSRMLSIRIGIFVCFRGPSLRHTGSRGDFITHYSVGCICHLQSQAGFLAGIQCGRRRRCRHYFQGELQLHPISLAPIILVRASPHIAHNGINGIIFSGPAGILAFRASTGSHYFHSPLNRGFHNTGAHAIRIKVI